MHETPSSAASIPEVLSHVRALTRRTVRDRSNQLWLEGIRQFVQAFDAHLCFDTVIYSRVLLKSDLAEMLVRRLKGRGTRCVAVTPEQFRSVCTTERASGIGAVARQPWTPLRELEASAGSCLLVIEDMRSPGNLGTILRTAEATGVGGVVFMGSSCDPFDPAVVRASMGGIFHLRLVRATPDAYRRWASEHSVCTVGLTPDAPRLWTEVPRGSGPVAVLLGEERQGLSTRGRALCDVTVRLPMAGRADSLNVGVAAGVMLYELVRRAQVSGVA
jgi:TrmH family RNA methyltransferase